MKKVVKDAVGRYDLKEIIGECIDDFEKLNIWECDFINSISEQQKLTKKQFEKLKEIHNKVKGKDRNAVV